MSLGAIFSGIGAAGSLLGGGGPSIDWSNYDKQTGNLSNLSSQYGDLGRSATTNYGADDTSYRNAVGNYVKYLQAGGSGSNALGTDQYNASKLASAAGNRANTYATANAHLSQSLASRGINPNSSIGAGALAGLASSQAAQAAQNQTALGQYEHDQQGNNLAKIAGIEGGLSGQDYSRASGTLGAQTGITSQLVGDAYKRAIGQYNNDVSQQNGVNSAFGQLGGSLGSMLGGKSVGSATSGGSPVSGGSSRMDDILKSLYNSGLSSDQLDAGLSEMGY